MALASPGGPLLSPLCERSESAAGRVRVRVRVLLLPLASDSAAAFPLAPAAPVATRALLREPRMVPVLLVLPTHTVHWQSAGQLPARVRHSSPWARPAGSSGEAYYSARV